MQSVASSHPMQYAAQGLTFGKVTLSVILVDLLGLPQVAPGVSGPADQQLGLAFVRITLS